MFFFFKEVHCKKETCDLWQNEWGYKTVFSCENSRRADVAIKQGLRRPRWSFYHFRH